MPGPRKDHWPACHQALFPSAQAAPATPPEQKPKAKLPTSRYINLYKSI